MTGSNRFKEENRLFALLPAVPMLPATLSGCADDRSEDEGTEFQTPTASGDLPAEEERNG